MREFEKVYSLNREMRERKRLRSEKEPEK